MVLLKILHIVVGVNWYIVPLKYIKCKPSFKDIMLCSALLVLAIALLQLSEKFLDESLTPYGTMASLGIVILVEIVVSRKK